MFGKKNALLLEESEAKVAQLQDKLEWYQRHYEKQQVYIEELYDVIGDLTRQFGLVLDKDNYERLQNHPNLEDNSNFMLDLYTLFSSRFKKGKNVTCYFGKELGEIKRRFQDRDFKNHSLVYLTERFSLNDLRTLFKEGLWRRPLDRTLTSIRDERKLAPPS